MIRPAVLRLALALALGLALGCGGAKTRVQGPPAAGPAKPPEQKAEGDVIAVTLSAVKDLNTFNRQPHTLVLVLYQLSQASVFTQLLETPAGRATLLEGEAFDASVLSRRRVVVQPGEVQQVVLDRMEDARHLAVVAGYYDAQPAQMSRLLAVKHQTSGFLAWKKPKPQLVNLRLGKGGFGQ